MQNDQTPAPGEPPPRNSDAGHAAGGNDTVVVVCGLTSMGIAAVYWTMRIGFDNPLAPVAKSVGLALFMFTFPAVLSWIPSRAGRALEGSAVRWWRSYPFLWLVGLSLTAVLGRLVPATGVNAFPVLAVVGAVGFAVVFVRWLGGAAVWRTAVLIAGCGAFSVWASGVVWGRIYKNPLFYENFILDGKVHHDSLHLAAIGNMLRTYHVATTGIDGLAYIPYHWGTQWLFAQWSNLLDAHVLDFYQLGFPVTMIPFFFGGTLAFAVAMRNRRGGPDAGDDLRNDFRFWLVFLAACIGIMPISGLDAIGVWTSNLLISESYTVAVPCALLLLASCIAFHDGTAGEGGRGADRSRPAADSLFLLFVLPVGIAALGYLKSSLMMLAFALAIYAFVRLRLYRRPRYCASIAVTTALFYLTWRQVILPAHREGFVPLGYLRSFVQPAWWPFSIVVQLFWSWLYILVRLRSEGIGTLADLREAAAERRILDVEVVGLVALLGLGPGLVTHIDGGAAFYFFDVQRWLAAGLILSRIPMLAASLVGEPAASRAKRRFDALSRVDATSVRTILLAFLLLPVVGSMLANSVVWPLRMARANAETRRALYPESVADGIPPGLHGLPSLADRALLDEGLRRSPNFVVADVLRRLSSLPDSVRRRTALFIPQDQRAYWQSLTRPGACTYEPFVAPALADMAMVDGTPPYGCTLSRYYGIGSFARREHAQTAADSEPPALCRRAVAAGLDRVLVLTFDSTRRGNTTVVQCQSSS